MFDNLPVNVENCFEVVKEFKFQLKDLDTVIKVRIEFDGKYYMHE